MDPELRLQVLRAAVRDRQFLRASAHDFTSGNFEDKSERVVIDIALNYWDQYGEPVGPMLRSDAEQKAKQYHLTQEERKALRLLIDNISQQRIEPIPVKALQDRVRLIKRDAFFDRALEDIVSAQEHDNLTAQLLEDIVDRASRELSDQIYHTTDFLEHIEQRILRRALQDETKKYPLLFIDGLDEKIKIIGRGQFGIWVAAYSVGKSHFLVHTAFVYAMQGLSGLYFTLEDPVDVVENRMDSCMTGIKMSDLVKMPNRLKRKFKSVRALIRGRIKLVDATEGGFTISKAEKMVEQERAAGNPVDFVIIDYDEEIECEKKYTGEMARKREFEEIYKRLRRMAKKLDILLWTAAQSKRGTKAKRIITGDDIGEDYSKAKKAFIAIGIGSDKVEANVKHLYVMRHRTDRSMFGIDVVTNFEAGIAYDREATLLRNRLEKGKK